MLSFLFCFARPRRVGNLVLSCCLVPETRRSRCGMWALECALWHWWVGLVKLVWVCNAECENLRSFIKSWIFLFGVFFRLAMITGSVGFLCTLEESLLWAVLMTRLWGSGTTKISAAWRPWVPMNILLPLWVSDRTYTNLLPLLFEMLISCFEDRYRCLLEVYKASLLPQRVISQVRWSL